MFEQRRIAPSNLMKLYIVGFALGLLALQKSSVLPDRSMLCGSLILLLIITFGVLYGQLKWKIPALLLCGLCSGATWGAWNAAGLLAWKLPYTAQGKVQTVLAKIVDLPKETAYGLRLKADVTWPDQHKINPIRMSLFLNTHAFNAHSTPFPRHTASTWRLCIRLKRLHTLLNPGGMDWEKYDLAQKIRAYGSIVPCQAMRRLHQATFSLDYLREQTQEHIMHTLGSHTQMAAILSALSVGGSQNITSQQWQILQDTGTTHLVAISGLHIGLVYGFARIIGCWIWSRSSFLMLYRAAPQIGCIFGLLMALIYSMLAGFSVPTVRAMCMLTFCSLARLCNIQLPSGHGLWLALGLMLWFTPLATFSMSFWLSFAAVAILLYVHTCCLKTRWRSLWLPVQMTTMMLPLSLLFFQKVSWIGCMANLLAVPWVGFCVVPLSLLGTFFLPIQNAVAHILLSVAAQSMSLLWKILTYCSHTPHACWLHTVASGGLFLMSSIAIMLWWAPSAFPWRWLGLYGILPLLFTHFSRPESHQAWISVLDVGQGLSVVVETQHHHMVFDTGPGHPGRWDAGRAVVIPYLVRRGVTRLDRLIVSHGDNDHSGGVSSIMKQFPETVLITSVPQRFRRFAAQPCYAGQHWEWDGVQFTLLAPAIKGHLKLRSNNNHSCVLQITTGKHRVLLPGDIERAAERRLVTNNPSNVLNSEILIAPHHGSRTSSTPDFVSAVNPHIVVFSTGYLNRYHFPHPKVVERYHAQKTQLFNTATCGMIQFKLTAGQKTPAPLCYRQQYRRFWL